ncbi:ABC superfamily ATP binding cassette transporter, ABC protein, partial [mine drainage metagenome]
MPRRYINSVMDEIIGFAELEQFIDNPVRNYSSGMYARLGFSIAIHMDPDILLLDEVLAVGDEAFQRRCIDHIDGMRREGRTLVFVSHAAETVRNLCDRCLWIEHGEPREVGETERVVDAYIGEVNRREMVALQASAAELGGTQPGWMGVRLTAVSFIGGGAEENAVETGQELSIQISYDGPRSAPQRPLPGFLL